LEEKMKRLCVILLLFFLLSMTKLASSETKPNVAIPPGALVIASDWLLDGDTPRGFTKEIKVGMPQVEIQDGFLKLSSKKSSFGFKKEVKGSSSKNRIYTGLGKPESCQKGVTFVKAKRMIRPVSSTCFFLDFLPRRIP